jgi:hypothetical protein
MSAYRERPAGSGRHTIAREVHDEKEPSGTAVPEGFFI